MKLSARNFNLTLNQAEKWPDLLSYLKSLKSLQYLVAAKENAPSTGHEHIHCFIQFKDAFKLSHKKLQGAHVEVCKGTPQQNRDYVLKDGNLIEEFGAMKKWGGFTIKDVKKMNKEERSELSFSYYTKVKALECDESNVLSASKYFKKVQVFYYWGESGVGKTKKAIEKIMELAEKGEIENDHFNEVKYCNGFWIGVENNSKCEVALYDDFRDNHMPASEFINFIDYNIHNMNVKNGHIKNDFKYIFITSIQSPEDLYPNPLPSKFEPALQWLRRITTIYHIEKI